MFRIKNRILKSLFTVLFVTLISFGLIGGCGTTAPEAPQDSTITLVPGVDDISICTSGLQTRLIRAFVTGPDGFPLNDIAVTFDVSFAGDQSLIIDTDGNGIGDSALLQLVDNDACPGATGCSGTPISDYVSFGALQDSPFIDITDDNGIAEVVIIIPGFFNIFDDTGQLLAADPASIAVFSGSAVITDDFGVNTDCDVPEMMDEGA